jgi:hypothetical protein
MLVHLDSNERTIVGEVRGTVGGVSRFIMLGELANFLTSAADEIDKALAEG